MECARCGASSREGARFCGECGAPFVRRCTGCDAELAPQLRFCDQCGTPVGAPAAGATTPAVPGVAVRKTVTVVFCDLGGSTRFGERTDAELAREVMARYHAILQEVIDVHGGAVAKFMGDGMMALFGIPEIAEDDAARAVRAGAELQRRFGAFAAEVAARHGETLTLRVGVNTGEVVIAAGDADLVGDALNVASRLEKACRPGHVLVGEETWRLTRGEFGYEPLGEVTVAGRDQPVSVYEVALEAATTLEPVAPFVGRDAEMQRLLAVFDLATASRSAQLATVLGSPGVGKTRLSRELCAHVESAAGAVTFEIRCDRAGDATFAPIASLIREATGLGDDADGPTARSHVSTLLAEEEADRDRLIEVLAGLVGAAPARSVEETFWAIRRLVESVAASRPMVVVIDDIQWAEPLLLDLLEHLTEWVRDVPVVLVCLARPELREVRPVLAETGRRVAEVVALDGLDSAATEQLAAGLLGTDRLPPGLIERLPESTDGNPLFVRELVRMLVDDQVIRQRDGEWELTIDADAVEVPPTIQSLLAARVERLPNTERELLEFASVIGAEFSLGALRELAGDHVPISTLLEVMRRKELVEPTGTYWGDEPVHRFHHVLIRDAAYRRLLKTTRADLHERVGVWTDRTASGLIGEHEAVIAYHYEQAYQYRRELGAVDDHVHDLGRRAAELLSTAANRALGRDDLAAAGALARRALQLLPDDDVKARAELLLVGCECLLASGDVVASGPFVAQLGEVARGDAGLEAWAACFAAQLVGLTDPEGLVGAEASVTAAADTLQDLDDSAGEAKAHQVRAGLLARLGRVGECELELDLALAAARSVDDRRRVTAVLGSAPNAALWGPSPVARAGGRCLDVVRLLRITTASPSVEATSMRCQAVLEALRGRFDVSRSMIASARATLEELGLAHGLMETELFAGMVELIAGDSAAAVEPLRAAYGGLGAMGVGADAGQAAALLSRALLAMNEVDEADEMATASENLAGQNLKTAIAWRVARAEVLAARGDTAAGIALAEAAVDIACATDYMIDHAEACVALMGLRDATGDAAGARAARAEALHLYEAKGATVPAQRLAGGDASVVTEPAPRVAPLPAERTEEPVVTSTGETERRTARAENAATRVTARIFELAVAGRVDEAGALFREDHIRVDRRHTVSGPMTDGRDAIVASLQVLVDLGFVTMLAQPLAVRGDRLHLSRYVFRTEDVLEVVMLGVSEIDANGLAAYTAWYDEDDLDAAMDDLDDRYVAGEGAPHADIAKPGLVLARALRSDDWDAAQAVLSPDFVVVDREPHGLFGEGDGDYFEQAYRSAAVVVGETTVATVLRTAHIKGRAILAVLESHRISVSGERYSTLNHLVVLFDASGRAARIEFFGPDGFEATLARLDELGATDPRTPNVENASTRATARLIEAVSAGSVDEMRALMGGEFVDRRRTVSGPGTSGFGESMESVRSLVEAGFVRDVFEPLAVRGDRLNMRREQLRTLDGNEIVVLAVSEVDAAGSFVYTAWYDEDDLDAAMDDLDDRYIAGEGASCADVLRPAHALDRALRSDDWNAVQSLLSPDFVVVDQSPLGLYGEGDRHYFESAARSAVEAWVVASSRYVSSTHIKGRALLAVTRSCKVTDYGSPLDSTNHFVMLFDPAGRATRAEWFGEDGFESALARLDELGAASEPNRVGGGAPPIGNAATRAVNAAPAESIASRGDRLALVRARSTDGLDTPTLTVFEVDESGRIAAAVNFDDRDIAAAFDELEDHYCAGEGAEHEYVVRRTGDFLRAYHARDWDAIEALYAPDFVAVDHRAISHPLTDGASVIAMLRALVDLAPDVMHHYRTLVVRGDVVFVCAEAIGTTADGSSYSWPFCSMSQFVAGLQVRTEVFDVEQYAEAYARFEELAGADTRTPHVDNAAVRAMTRGVWLGAAGDFAAAGQQVAEDVVRVDHRAGIPAPPTRGRAAYVENLEALVETFGRAMIEWLAVRGERLALARFLWRAENDFEAPALALFELDEAGQLINQLVLSVTDLAVAIEELDARAAAIRGDEPGACEVAARDLIESTSSGTAFLRKAYFAEQAGVLIGGLIGESQEGSERAWDSMRVVKIDARGRLERMEYFPLEQWDDALALFDSWAFVSEAPEIDNGASRSARELFSVWAAGDVEGAVARFVADDVEHVSRRRVVSGLPWQGRAAFVENASALFDVFRDGISLETIATRGDRLALMRGRVVASDSFEMVSLAVFETDAAGALAHWVTFDEDDIGSAFDELEDRYCAGEGRADAYMVQRVGDSVRAFSRRDWDAYEALFAPACVAVDHRRIGQPLFDRASIVAMVCSLVDVAPDAVHLVQTLNVRGDMAIMHIEAVGPTPEGNLYSWLSYAVAQSVAGQISRFEIFDVEQDANAHARFEELAREPRTPHADNPVIRILQRARWLYSAGEVDEAQRHLAPDVVRIDRRSGVWTPTLHGREAFTENVLAALEVFGSIVFEPLAVRGDRLLLLRLTYVSASGFAAPGIAVYEMDNAALLRRCEIYDEADFALALQELEARYDEIRDDPGACEEIVRRERAAFDRRDFDELESYYAPDFVAVDHRPLGFPDADRAEYFERTLGLDDITSEFTYFARKSYFAERAGIGVTAFAGTTPEESEYTWELFLVARTDAHDRFARIEYFPEDQWAEALARFDEWAAAPVGPEIENAAFRAVRDMWSAYSAGDFAAVAERFVADDIEHVTRRRLASGGFRGRDASIVHSAALFGAFPETRAEPLAVRGDHLVLALGRSASAEGFEIVSLGLYETDAARALVYWASYDEEDLAAALDELEDRYCAGEGSEDEYVIRRVGDSTRAFARRDWPAFEQLFAENLHVVDRRTTGSPLADRAALVAMQQSFIDAAPDAVRVIGTLEVRGDVVLMRVEDQGSSSDVNRYLTVTRHVTGEIVELELFDVEQYDHAHARFEELEIENAAFRAVRDMWRAVSAGDVEAAAEQFVADDVEHESRRRVVSSPSWRGRDAFIESSKALLEVWPEGISVELVAARGDRLVLVRCRAEANGFEQLVLAVCETNVTGDLMYWASFDEDDLQAALDELEDRYCAGEGVEHEYMIRRVGDAMRAFARRDWMAFERLLASDLHAADHRVMGFPLSDRASFVALQQSLIDVASDVVRVYRTLEVLGDAALGRVDAYGTSLDRSRYEWEGLVVLRSVAGESVEVELFDLDQRGAARARFDEWARETRTSDLDNEVLRIIRRVVWLSEFGEERAVEAYIADDIETLDCRSVVSLPATHGREAFGEAMRVTRSAFATYTLEPLAVRGDRLALSRVRVASPDGFEMRGLTVYESDATGRLCRTVTFDESDAVTALEALESRHRELQGDE